MGLSHPGLALYRPGLIGHLDEHNPWVEELPDPVPVTRSAMTPEEKLLSAAAASRLGLRLDPELSRSEWLWAGRRSAQAAAWPDPSVQPIGYLDRLGLRRAVAGERHHPGPGPRQEGVACRPEGPH